MQKEIISLELFIEYLKENGVDLSTHNFSKTKVLHLKNLSCKIADQHSSSQDYDDSVVFKKLMLDVARAFVYPVHIIDMANWSIMDASSYMNSIHEDFDFIENPFNSYYNYFLSLISTSDNHMNKKEHKLFYADYLVINRMLLFAKEALFNRLYSDNYSKIPEECKIFLMYKNRSSLENNNISGPKNMYI